MNVDPYYTSLAVRLIQTDKTGRLWPWMMEDWEKTEDRKVGRKTIKATKHEDEAAQNVVVELLAQVAPHAPARAAAADAKRIAAVEAVLAEALAAANAAPHGLSSQRDAAEALRDIQRTWEWISYGKADEWTRAGGTVAEARDIVERVRRHRATLERVAARMAEERAAREAAARAAEAHEATRLKVTFDSGRMSWVVEGAADYPTPETVTLGSKQKDRGHRDYIAPYTVEFSRWADETWNAKDATRVLTEWRKAQRARGKG